MTSGDHEAVYRAKFEQAIEEKRKVEEECQELARDFEQMKGTVELAN